MNAAVVLCLSLAQAPDADSKAAARFLAPFLDEQTLFVLRIRIDQLTAGRATAVIRPLAGDEEHAKAAAEMAKMEKTISDMRAAGAKDWFFVYSFGDAYLFKPRWPIKFVMTVPKETTTERVWQATGAPKTFKADFHPDAISFRCKRRSTPVATVEEQLAEAFASAKSAPATAVVLVTPDHRRVLLEFNRPLASLQWISVSLDGPKDAVVLPGLKGIEDVIIRSHDPGKQWTGSLDDSNGRLQRFAAKMRKAFEAASAAMDRAKRRNAK